MGYPVERVRPQHQVPVPQDGLNGRSSGNGDMIDMINLFSRPGGGPAKGTISQALTGALSEGRCREGLPLGNQRGWGMGYVGGRQANALEAHRQGVCEP